MALTNPTDLVDLQGLAYFKSKADSEYAKGTQMPTLASESDIRAIVTGYSPSNNS